MVRKRKPKLSRVLPTELKAYLSSVVLDAESLLFVKEPDGSASDEIIQEVRNAISYYRHQARRNRIHELHAGLFTSRRPRPRFSLARLLKASTTYVPTIGDPDKLLADLDTIHRSFSFLLSESSPMTNVDVHATANRRADLNTPEVNSVAVALRNKLDDIIASSEYNDKLHKLRKSYCTILGD